MIHLIVVRMKRNLIYPLSVLLLILVSLNSCGNDDSDDVGDVVVVKEDGTTSNGSVFLKIDDNSFYLDYVKYEVNSNGDLMVSGYSEWQARGVANIFPKVSINGHTYNVRSVHGAAFKNCSGLTSVTIPDGVRYIGRSAFSGCSGLTSLFIPESVNDIDSWAFSGCSGLKSISVAAGNEVYDSRNNCNALIETKSNGLIKGCVNTIIPDNIINIYMDAFAGCSDMLSVTIPNSVIYINQKAFENCSSLTTLTLPKSLLEISGSALDGCSGLTSIHCKSENPPNDDYVFTFESNIYSSATLYVPNGSLNAYKKAPTWSRFKNIVEE